MGVIFKILRHSSIILSLFVALFFAIMANAQVITPTIKTGIEQKFNVYLTGYSYWDNTPPESAIISHPVIHKIAGGTGSFTDPITLAVGHSIIEGKDILDFPAGTKFYIALLRKYAIVEDSCGDGDSPQNVPCHIGYKGVPWLDIYVDGAGLKKEMSDQCASHITDIQMVILTPKPNYPVVLGSITNSGCEIFKD